MLMSSRGIYHFRGSGYRFIALSKRTPRSFKSKSGMSMSRRRYRSGAERKYRSLRRLEKVDLESIDLLKTDISFKYYERRMK